MSNSPADRIARWLSREVFGDARGDITGLRLVDGQQVLQEFSLQAGDDAATIARDLLDTLATYYDPVSERRGHTYHVAPVFRGDATPRIGKLPVKLTPESMATSELARAPSINDLATLAGSIGAAGVAAPPPGDAWKDQAKFNASQVGLLTGTIVNMVQTVGSQQAAVFDTITSTLALTQKSLSDALAECDRLRTALSTEQRLHEDTRDIARMAVKQVEELSAKLREEKDSNKFMAPIMDEIGGKVGAAVAEVVRGATVVKAPVNGAEHPEALKPS